MVIIRMFLVSPPSTRWRLNPSDLTHTHSTRVCLSVYWHHNLTLAASGFMSHSDSLMALMRTCVIVPGFAK